MGNGGGGDLVGVADLVDGGSGVVVGHGVLVDHGGLDHLVDGVDLEGLGHGHGAGHGHLVGPLHALLDQDLAVDGDGHVDGHVNGHLVHVELGLDAGQAGGDDLVGACGGQDLLLGDGVGGSGAQVDGARGHVQRGSGGVGQGGGSDGDGIDGVDGLAGGEAVGSGLVDVLPGDEVLVSHLDGLGADLDGAVSDHAVLHLLLDDGLAGVVGLSHVSHRGAGRDGRGVSVGVPGVGVPGVGVPGVGKAGVGKAGVGVASRGGKVLAAKGEAAERSHLEKKTKEFPTCFKFIFLFQGLNHFLFGRPSWRWQEKKQMWTKM